jgi:RNA polymerase sigma factor (sigma-70 family)
MDGVAAALAEHAYEHLFIECLGWDRLRSATAVTRNDATLHLTAVAQKRGVTVFHCPAHRTVLANRSLLRDVQRQIRRTHHEHILIYSCETPRKQVWQWATVLADGRRILHREHPFFSSEPPERLIERIEGLAVGIHEEEQTTLPDVLLRVRSALMPDSELNLFARHPTYAAESDRLAMAMKRGEPGALQSFVEFHMPLARKASRMLVRWFGMDPEDAEQTAMIGLMEAARRFDPERGYQFSTYASYWIRQCCQRYGLEWGMPIRMPTYVFWPCYKMAFVEAELIATHGEHGARSRFDRELTEAAITREQWECFCTARRLACFSDVDAPRQALLGKLDESANVERDAVTHETCDEVARNVDLLTGRQALILKMRYGIGHPEHTLEEVGDELRITRERVRQIQAKAEERLQRLLLQSRLRHDDLVRENSKPEQAAQVEDA